MAPKLSEVFHLVQHGNGPSTARAAAVRVRALPPPVEGLTSPASFRCCATRSTWPPASPVRRGSPRRPLQEPSCKPQLRPACTASRALDRLLQMHDLRDFERLDPLDADVAVICEPSAIRRVADVARRRH